MPKLVINLSSHPQPTTVSQMRKRLAQVLSKLNGDQEVSFNFIATLETYQPAQRANGGLRSDFYSVDGTQTGRWANGGLLPTAVFGELARPEND